MSARLWTALLLAGACNAAEPTTPAAAPVEAAADGPAVAPPMAPTPAGPPARGSDAERASKNGTASMKLGDVDVSVTYGRPQIHGRQVWDHLVPYGKVWRTGADEATVITFSGDVKLGETAVKKGSYALFTLPDKEQWTIILNSQAEQWGAYDYDAGKDVAKAVVTPEKAPMTEAFTIQPDGDTLYLQWAELRVPVPLALP